MGIVNMALLRSSEVWLAEVLPHRFVASLRPLKLTDSAILAMTGFANEPSLAVDEAQPIDTDVVEMIRFGVGALLVMQRKRVVGLIISSDVQSERLRQFFYRSTHSRFKDIRVGDMMTPWADLQVIGQRAIQAARISDLVEIFRATDSRHLIVVETHACSDRRVHGLVSRAHLLRRLSIADVNY
jgi:predicted transcriptional regulator